MTLNELENETHHSKKIILPVLIGSVGLLSMTVIAQLLQKGVLPSWTIAESPVVNQTVTMQAMVLPISLVALISMFVLDKEKSRTFFRWGHPDYGNNWKTLGPMLAIGFTTGTTLLMSMSVMSQGGSMNALFFKLLPLVLIISAANAWSEEIFARFVIVAGLSGKVKSEVICWISAVIFGLPHFFGTPSGLFGVVMSGLLGWVLAKSVIETRGIGWAWLIHFLQDVIIFGAGAMILAGNTAKP